MALQTQAMLVNLTISQWDARKFDKTATKDVESKHGAQNAGRFNKLLIDDAALKPIAQLAGAMRLHHYKITLPWGDNGDRLLPSKLYLQYTRDMRALRDDFNREVSKFVTEYPNLVASARKRLGTLYDPVDYPASSDIHRRFDASFSFMPVPDAKDFRVEVAAEDAEIIRADIEAKVRDRQLDALNDTYKRAREFVTRVRDVCSMERPRIFDSLMGNVKDLATMLPAFNISDDPQLTKLETDLRHLVTHPDTLRTRPDVRRTVAKAAEAILAELPA